MKLTKVDAVNAEMSGIFHDQDLMMKEAFTVQELLVRHGPQDR